MEHKHIFQEVDDSERCCVCGKTFTYEDEPLNYRELDFEDDRRKIWYWHRTCGPIDMIIEIN